MEDLARIRRFSLLMGVLLISYVLAGIRIKPGETFEAYGFSWEILRPELLPIGLALGSLYGLISYTMNAFVFRRSPRRQRASALRSLSKSDRENETWYSESFTAREAVDVFGSRLMELFPPARRRDVEVDTVTQHPSEMSGLRIPLYSLKVRLPDASVRLARVRDVDYLLPVFVNISALAIYLAFLVRNW